MQKKKVFAFLGFLIVGISLFVSCSSPARDDNVYNHDAGHYCNHNRAQDHCYYYGSATSNKPQYGGVITMISQTNYTIFGAAISNRPGGVPGMWEQLTYSDRTRSVGGGGTAYYADGPTTMQDVVGALASKWATPDPNTWVLDIRQGVHFSKVPNNLGSDLVNGREMTADDVVASIEFIRDTPSSWASG